MSTIKQHIGLLCTLLIIAGIGSVLYWRTQLAIQETNIPISQEQTQDSNSTANWKTYRNDQYGFEFKYPSNWIPDQNNRSDVKTFHVLGQPPVTGNEPEGTATWQVYVGVVSLSQTAVNLGTAQETKSIQSQKGSLFRVFYVQEFNPYNLYETNCNGALVQINGDDFDYRNFLTMINSFYCTIPSGPKTK